MAVFGSIALVLSAAPAHSAERGGEERMQRPAPLPNSAAGTTASKAPRTVAATKVPTVAVPATYTVQPGDTVSAIAARFGLRTVDVLTVNGLSWSSIIYPGQILALGGGPAPAPPAPAAPPAAASSAYTIQRGDTISAIAKRHGLSVPAVLSANGLGWSSIIYPGQTLVVPGQAAAVPAPPAPPPAPTPAPAPGAYVVAAGDTVSAIAQRHGVSVQAVLSANGLAMSSIIYPGQKIAIPATAGAAPAVVSGLDAEQIDNARLIITIGRELGVPDRGIAIALGAAMQESWLRNLDWGDRDSLGLFQQRPSTGWGTEAEVRDRVHAIGAFYGGAADPNGARTRGLLDIPGWQDMTFAQAAQAVQVSAYPDRYAQWENPAYAWLAALG